MRKILFSFALLICFCFSALSQTDTITTKKRKRFTFYGMWGYNREAYTRSTITFQNNGKAGYNDPTHSTYNFTIHDVKAHDSPDFDKIAGSWQDVVNLTIPQFNGRIGVYFNNDRDEGFEISYDHAKYVVTDGQDMHFTGTALGRPLKYDSIPLRKNFHFEHTDGANFVIASYVRRWKIYKSPNKKHNLGILLKPGAGIVVPRTDVTIFGTRLNNYWHIAGAIAGVETGFRAQFWQRLCVELTTRLSYADYMQCLVQYAGNGTAHHMFGTIGGLLNVGYQFSSFVPNWKFHKKHSNQQG